MLLVVPVILGVVSVSKTPPPDPEAEVVPDGIVAPAEPPAALVRSVETAPNRHDTLTEGWKPLAIEGEGAVVAHGETGWLAVAGGDAVARAYTSENGVQWMPHTIPIRPNEGATSAVVTTDLMVVLTASGDPGPPMSYLSPDGGDTWESQPVGDRPGHFELATLGETVYAIGGTSSTPWDFTTGVPSVFVLEGGGRFSRTIIQQQWAEIGFAEELSPGGRVSAVVAGPDGPVALGFSGVGPAAWTLDGGMWWRNFLEMAEDQVGGFWSVVPDEEGGWLGATGELDTGIASAVLASPDLVAWHDSGQPLVRNRALEQAGGIPFLLGDGGAFLDGQWREIGLTPGSYVWTVAGTADRLVAGGSDEVGRATLWVWGTVTSPVVVYPPVAAGSWTRVATLEGHPDVGDRVFPVEHEGAIFIGAANGLWWIPDPVAAPEVVLLQPLTPEVEGFESVIPYSTSLGPFANWGNQLYRYLDDGSWVREELGQLLAGLVPAEYDGRLRAVGQPPAGNPQVVVIERDEEGVWTEIGVARGVDWVIGQAPGAGFLGFFDDKLVSSDDGLNWTAVDGYQGVPVYGQGAVIIEHPDGNVTVGLDGITIKVAAAQVKEVQRAGERILVRTDREVLIFSADGEPVGSIPFDLESGLRPISPQLLPTDPPMAVGVVDGQLIVYRWTGR